MEPPRRSRWWPQARHWIPNNGLISLPKPAAFLAFDWFTTRLICKLNPFWQPWKPGLFQVKQNEKENQTSGKTEHCVLCVSWCWEVGIHWIRDKRGPCSVVRICPFAPNGTTSRDISSRSDLQHCAPLQVQWLQIPRCPCASCAPPRRSNWYWSKHICVSAWHLLC